MGLAVLILLGAVIALWSALLKAARRLDLVEKRLAGWDVTVNELALLYRRVGSLEDRVQAGVAGTTTLPETGAEADEPAPAPIPTRPETPAAVEPPAATSPPPEVASPASAPRAPAPVLPAHPEPDLPPTPDDVPSEAEGWEVTVGTSWLNKIGVTVTVIGIALMVGYSMANVGPAGRVILGYVLSIALLAAGVVFERRDAYRNYGYGLVAGGWAGLYFTTYAMRAVPAAQIITSDVVGTAGLALVAVGMIGHSLRYRSQTVTGLAYVVAFITLMLTPLRMFSLVATVPLAASLLFISQRFGWVRVSVLGVAATYAVFVLRTQALGSGASPFALTPEPYLVLAAYWLTFEIADIAARRRRPDEDGEVAPLFALNAVGLLLSGLIQLPPDVRFMTWFATVSAAAFLASAIVRARLLGLRHAETVDAAAFTTTHGAIAMAAALALWSVDLRFAGVRESLGLLLGAELLFLSGLALRDVHVRHMATIGGAVATLHVLHLAGLAGGPVVPAAGLSAGWSATALILAATWYANRETLRLRRLAPAMLEYGYSWTGTWLIVPVLDREFEFARALLAALALAAVLIEVGLRRRPEYRWQGYIVGPAAAVLMLPFFALGGGTPSDTWTVLPLAVVLAYAVAVRLARTPAGIGGRGARLAAGLSATFGTALLATFQHEVLPPEMVGPVWSATGLVLLLAGSWRHVPLLRGHAYALLVSGPAFAFGAILRPADATPAQLASVLAALMAAYAGTQIARGPIRAAWPDGGEPPSEETARLGLSVLATLVLTAVIALEAPDNAITLLWGLEGLALLGLGFPARDRVLRLSGLGLLLLCILKLFLYDLRELEALPRIISFVVLGVVLLAVSWVYTRFRDRLRRYL